MFSQQVVSHSRSCARPELVTGSCGSWWAVPAPVGHTNEGGALESTTTTAHVLYANYLPGIGRGLFPMAPALCVEWGNVQSINEACPIVA